MDASAFDLLRESVNLNYVLLTQTSIRSMKMMTIYDSKRFH